MAAGEAKSVLFVCLGERRAGPGRAAEAAAVRQGGPGSRWSAGCSGPEPRVSPGLALQRSLKRAGSRAEGAGAVRFLPRHNAAAV